MQKRNMQMFEKNFNNSEDKITKKEIFAGILILLSTLFGNVLVIAFCLFLLKTLGWLISISLFLVFTSILVIYRIREIKNIEEKEKMTEEQINEISKTTEIIKESNNNRVTNFQEIPISNQIEDSSKGKKIYNIVCGRCNSKFSVYQNSPSGVCNCGLEYTIVLHDNKMALSIENKKGMYSYISLDLLKVSEEEENHDS